MSKPNNYSRRKFITASSAVAAGTLLGSSRLIGVPAIIKHFNKPNSNINGVQIGVITYSFRSMPDQSAEGTLKNILACDINAIELMGGPAESFAGMPESKINRGAIWALMRKQREGDISENEAKELAEMREAMEAHQKKVAEWRAGASMDKFEQFRKMYEDAGVSIYGFKPSAFGKNNTDAEIDYGFRAAKALGASHVTLEHPSDDEHTLKLGEMAKKHKIKVAYHGHEQQTPTFWDTALEQSEYNALNIDVGHYVAAGFDPMEILKEKNEHICSMHMKDRQTPENGKGNLMWGRGDTPLKEILQLMKKEKYTFPGTIELEYKVPYGSYAIKEVQKCLEFCRKALS
jgi:sugar phosphate isomerase/epimerase